MSIVITVDTSQFDAMQESVQSAISNLGEGLKEAVDAIVMPDLLMLSQTLYNVITGEYSTGWYDVQIDDMSVMVDCLAPYAQILETGSVRMEGRAVLEQATEDTVNDLAGYVQSWIMSQVGIS